MWMAAGGESPDGEDRLGPRRSGESRVSDFGDLGGEHRLAGNVRSISNIGRPGDGRLERERRGGDGLAARGMGESTQ